MNVIIANTTASVQQNNLCSSLLNPIFHSKVIIAVLFLALSHAPTTAFILNFHLQPCLQSTRFNRISIASTKPFIPIVADSINRVAEKPTIRHLFRRLQTEHIHLFGVG